MALNSRAMYQYGVGGGGGVANKKKILATPPAKVHGKGLSYFLNSILDFLYAFKCFFCVQFDTFLYCRIVVCNTVI